MIKKTKPQGKTTAPGPKGKNMPIREGVKRKTAPVREGLAYLIEDALERSEVVIAAESIVEKLQAIAEDLATIEAKDIMPLLDALTNSFGPDVAQSFNSIATEQVRQLVAAMQSAKTSLDGEILRLKKGVEGGDISDMGMDAASASAPMMPSGVPDEAGMGEPGMDEPPLPDDGLPSPDMTGNAEDDLSGNFAGREKKESAAPKGKPLAWQGRRGRMAEARARHTPDVAKQSNAPKKVMEYEAPMAMPGVSRPAVGEPHSHESNNFAPNVSNLSAFHGGAGRLAQSITNMIRTEELSLEQRKSLANVLSHLAAFAAEPAHWSGIDADKKLEMSLQSSGIWEAKTPAVQKIVAQMKRLCHLLSLHHDSMLESNISMLRKASDPDALILKTFRVKLAENRDGQMAAIRTARTFAIDIEDVIAVVKEAAARRPFNEVKRPAPVKHAPKYSRLAEFKGDTAQWEEKKPKKGEKFGGKQAKPFGKKKTVAEDFSDADKARTGRQSNAFKSKMAPNKEKSGGKFGGKQAKPFGKKEVEEDSTGTGQPASVQQPAVNGAGQPAQTVPMFPVEQGSPVKAMPPTAAMNSMTAQSSQMQPPANQSLSTNKPLTPADKRAQAAQQVGQQQNQQQHHEQGQQTNPQGKPIQTSQQGIQTNAQGQPVQMNAQGLNPAPNQQQQTDPPSGSVQQPQFKLPGNVMTKNNPAIKRAAMQK